MSVVTNVLPVHFSMDDSSPSRFDTLGFSSFHFVAVVVVLTSRVMTEGDTPALRKVLAEILYTDGSFSMSRLAGLLNSAMGYVGMSKDAIVDLDAVPEDGASLSKLVSFILSDKAVSIRNTLADEFAKAIDIYMRRAVLVQTNAMMSTLLNIPPPFRFGFAQVEQANSLSRITKQEEIFLDSLLKLISTLIDVRVHVFHGCLS